MAIAALRYNNPFDVSLPIAGWNGGGDTVGIQGQPGFGAFPDMATGYQAGVQRLHSYLTGQSYRGAGLTRCPLCADSDELPQRSEMTRWAKTRKHNGLNVE